MAKSVLDIIIKTVKQGGADKETIKSLVDVKKGLLEAAAVGGSFVAAGIAIKKVLDESLGVFVAAADKVRRYQDATGLSAEESSKLIQVLDDEKISFEQLEKVVAKNGKTFDFSIAGLGRMSEQYLKLTTAQERATFMNERFGKQWISFVPVMEKGEAALTDMSEAVNENQILLEEDLETAREYEIAMDTLGDTIEGAKIKLGSWVGQLIIANVKAKETSELYEELTGEQARLGMNVPTEEFKAFTAQMDRGKAMTELYKAQMKETAEVIEGEVVPSMEDLQKANANIISDAIKLTDSQKDFQKGQAATTAKIAEYQAKLEELFPWETEKRQEILGQIGELEQKYADDAAAFEEASRRKIAMMVIEKIAMQDGMAGFSEIEQAKAFKYLETLGVAESAAARRVIAEEAVAQAMADGILEAHNMDFALRKLEKGYSIDVVLNTIANMTGGKHISKGTAAEKAGIVSGFQHGGISTGPQSGHMELLHGTEAVIPLQGGAVPVKMQGGAGVNVYLTISSPVTILDQQSAKNTLLPFIEAGIREAKSRGSI